MKMTKRELKRAIRRNMTTARQHAKAAADLASRAGRKQIPAYEHNSIITALSQLRQACVASYDWWKNA